MLKVVGHQPSRFLRGAAIFLRDRFGAGADVQYTDGHP